MTYPISGPSDQGEAARSEKVETCRLWQERAPHGPWFVHTPDHGDIFFGADKDSAEQCLAALRASHPRDADLSGDLMALRNDIQRHIFDGQMRNIAPYDVATSILLFIQAALPRQAAAAHSGDVSPSQKGSETPIGHPGFGVWLPIETAPKDEDLLLGWWEEWPMSHWRCTVEFAGSTKGGWLNGRATHWMSLPAGPSSTVSDDRSAVNASDEGSVNQSAAHSGEGAGERAAIIDECAKVADKEANAWLNGPATTAVGQAYQWASKTIAANIRALSPPVTEAAGSQPAMKAVELEQLKLGIAAVAFALGWTDLKGVSLEQFARDTRAQLASARKALEFYADPFAWKKLHDPEDVVRVPDFYSETSFGDTALAALTPDHVS